MYVVIFFPQTLLLIIKWASLIGHYHLLKLDIFKIDGVIRVSKMSLKKTPCTWVVLFVPS